MTALIYDRGISEKVALLTDGRFSGATRGVCIDDPCPEAADGTLNPLLQDGDRIAIAAQASCGSCRSAAEPPSFQVNAEMLIR